MPIGFVQEAIPAFRPNLPPAVDRQQGSLDAGRGKKEQRLERSRDPSFMRQNGEDEGVQALPTAHSPLWRTRPGMRGVGRHTLHTMFVEPTTTSRVTPYDLDISSLDSVTIAFCGSAGVAVLCVCLHTPPPQYATKVTNLSCSSQVELELLVVIHIVM